MTSTPLRELQTILQQLVLEHRRLLGQVDAHQAAMKKLDLRAMEQAAKQQESARLRIASMENRRRLLVGQLAVALKLGPQPTLSRLAEAVPGEKARLLGLRDELKALVSQISARVTVAGRLAGALLGHLNTVVRLIAGAVEQAGLYTRDGVPKVSQRIGVIEAVG